MYVGEKQEHLSNTIYILITGSSIYPQQYQSIDSSPTSALAPAPVSSPLNLSRFSFATITRPISAGFPHGQPSVSFEQARIPTTSRF
jgi:hypothetical protein